VCAAGGISTPHSALAAFMMGAAYVVSGSVNQACVEAGASPHTKKLLAEADMADVIMAPAADMFEMGVKVQVLKRGTLFAMRAQKLFDLYKAYNAVEEIPQAEREKLEKQIFRQSIDTVWNETVAFFNNRDPDQITRAANNPRRKMALIFRWYLGLSSRWSNIGEKGREIDYQIWCGPSIGAFNDWVRGSYLEEPANRRVVDVATHIMTGAAYLYRLQHLRMQGLDLPAQFSYYEPTPISQVPSSPNVTNKPAPIDHPEISSPPAQASSFANPPASEVKTTKRAEEIQNWLVSHLADLLEVRLDDIDIREPFSNYNLDSAQVLVLASKLEEKLGYQLSPTLLWNYPTIEALTQRLAEEDEFAKTAVPGGTEKGA
jgi:acyl carrier protein